MTLEISQILWRQSRGSDACDLERLLKMETDEIVNELKIQYEY